VEVVQNAATLFRSRGREILKLNRAGEVARFHLIADVAAPMPPNRITVDVELLCEAIEACAAGLKQFYAPAFRMPADGTPPQASVPLRAAAVRWDAVGRS
jgi:hypothetical protein